MLFKNALILSSSLLVATVLIGCGKDRSSTQPAAAEKSSSTEASAKNQTIADWKSVTLHFEGFTKSKSGST